jgi:hypothetical protein
MNKEPGKSLAAYIDRQIKVGRSGVSHLPTRCNGPTSGFFLRGSAELDRAYLQSAIVIAEDG